MTDQDQFDLDEDLFYFEEVSQERELGSETDESLESIFATFQSEEDALAAVSPAASLLADADMIFESGSMDLPDLAFADDDHEGIDDFPAPAPRSAPIAAAVAASQPVANAVAVAPAAKQSMSLSAFSKSALLILISVTLLNGMVGFVVLKQSSSIMKNVSNTGMQLLDTAGDIKRNTLENTREHLNNGAPLPIWDVDNHPTLELAGQDIEVGNYAEARKKLSTFLSLIDGIDPKYREDLEARAKMLIASSMQLEALTFQMGDQR